MKALNLVSDAIQEVKLGIEAARAHADISGSAEIRNAVFEQSRMRAALDHLNAAKSDLQAATANKGGHRAKALKLVNKAITEVQDGIAYESE